MFERSAQFNHWLVALVSPVIYVALCLYKDYPICFGKIKKKVGLKTNTAKKVVFFFCI